MKQRLAQRNKQRQINLNYLRQKAPEEVFKQFDADGSGDIGFDEFKRM